MHAEFSAALLDPTATPPADILIRGGADPARRFGVYRNNVIVALIDALTDTYPVVCALVGEEFFRAMAREFARQHPPRSPVMAEYGGEFAEFIDGFPPAAPLPYLGDVARLEWQRVVSWHAADATSLSADDIAPLLADPASLMQTCWRLHPSLALQEAPFAVVSLWAAHQQGNAAAVDSALNGLDTGQPEAALVLRQGLEVLILRLTPAEACFMRTLQSGAALGVAVDAAGSSGAPFDLTLMFSLLLRSGALIGYTSATEETTGP